MQNSGCFVEMCAFEVVRMRLVEGACRFHSHPQPNTQTHTRTPTWLQELDWFSPSGSRLMQLLLLTLFPPSLLPSLLPSLPPSLCNNPGRREVEGKIEGQSNLFSISSLAAADSRPTGEKGRDGNGRRRKEGRNDEREER